MGIVRNFTLRRRGRAFSVVYRPRLCPVKFLADWRRGDDLQTGGTTAANFLSACYRDSLVVYRSVASPSGSLFHRTREISSSVVTRRRCNGTLRYAKLF